MEEGERKLVRQAEPERAGNSCLSPSPWQGNTLRALHAAVKPGTQLHPFISSVIDGAFRHPLQSTAAAARWRSKARREKQRNA